MKELIKNITKFVVTCALLVALNAPAATVTITSTNGTTLAGNSGNPIITTNVAQILSYTLANTSAAAIFIKFYDSPNQTITNLLGAYTNRTQYLTNLVVNYTNVVGVIESNTNQVLVNLQNITAASLAERRVVWTYQIPAATTVTYTPTYPHNVSLGLMSTNGGTPVQVTVEYLPLR